jgi:hypothetical protein
MVVCRNMHSGGFGITRKFPVMPPRIIFEKLMKPAVVLLHPSRRKLPPMYFVTIFLSKFAHFTHQGTMKAEKRTSGSCGGSSTLSVDEAGFWRRTIQVQVILRAWSNAHARVWCD